jgi:hypothetical protein
MSTSDQAKSKLLDSMRVSKEGAKEVPVAEKTEPVKKAAPANKAKVTKKAAKPAAKKTAASKETVSDSFQAAKRVWPD